MALARLQDDAVYRWRLAHRLAFADWANPTAAEMNVNSDNSDPAALMINPTCAINTDGSQFDLDDPELDESLTFCQRSGDAQVLSRSATVVIEYLLAKTRWSDAASTASVDGYNTANLVHSWLAWRGLSDIFVILSVGKNVDEPFAVGDELKIVEVATDWAIPNIATGSNVSFTQTFAKRSDISWNTEITA